MLSSVKFCVEIVVNPMSQLYLGTARRSLQPIAYTFTQLSRISWNSAQSINVFWYQICQSLKFQQKIWQKSFRQILIVRPLAPARAPLSKIGMTQLDAADERQKRKFNQNFAFQSRSCGLLDGAESSRKGRRRITEADVSDRRLGDTRSTA